MKARRKPGRPKRHDGTLPTRDRLLDAAEKLFYANGIVNTGIEEVAEAADVSKMSIYQHFESKDGLAVEYLNRFHERWLAWMDERLAKGPDEPGARLVRIVELAGEWSHRTEIHGCAFINAAAQCRASHGADQRGIGTAATRHKNQALALLTELAHTARLDQPALVADQLLLLIDGVLVGTMMQRSGDPCAASTRAAKLLVDAARTTRPRPGRPRA